MATAAAETNHLAALSHIPGASNDGTLPALDSSMLPPELASMLANVIPPSTTTTTDRFDIIPLKGYVIKTALTRAAAAYPAGMKLFVNMTHSPYVPAPPPASDDEIRKVVSGETPTSEGGKPVWRVPMSLSSLRDDLDKNGRPCIVCDALIHSDVLFKGEHDADFQSFLIELALAFVEQKHATEVSRDLTVPKMRSKGDPASHSIYRPKRAGIAGLTKQVPEYRLKRVLKDGGGALRISVQMPLLYSADKVALDVEPGRLELDHAMYGLSMALDPVVDVDSGRCDAAFDRSTRTLHVYLPYLVPIAL
ncbi:pre-RNA processing PIH1/Nop17-domain-containing protein [Blastocladiella britannica]|nr:pre-RNA processing PIH1/Nop17-domain-containing protein [Blastocladiella britannica]